MASRHDRKGSLRDKESAPLFRKAITKNAFLEKWKGGGKKVGGGKNIMFFLHLFVLLRFFSIVVFLYFLMLTCLFFKFPYTFGRFGNAFAILP